MGTRKPAFMKSLSESEAVEIDGIDVWLEEFLRNQKEEVSPTETENLRQVFQEERKILEKLFEPIRDLMGTTLKDDRLNKGARLYDEWGKMRRKECLLSYYDNEYFRATYAKQRFINSATSFMQALHLRIIPETPAVESYLSRVRRVISVGVGPGSDIAGFLAYTRSRNISQRLVYFTMDQCSEWSKYVYALEKRFSSEFGLSVWFKTFRFGKRETVDFLPDADMLVFSFANTSLMDQSIWPLLQQRIPLIIVLDGIKEVLIDGFGDSSFKKFQLNDKTNVYYSFSDPDNPNSTNEETDGAISIPENSDSTGSPVDDSKEESLHQETNQCPENTAVN